VATVIHSSMVDIAAAVDALGGMAQKRQLVARGARDLDLTRAVRSGDVSRARQGWYTTLPAADPRVRAVRVGGRLTGVSAIDRVGGWVLGPHPLHVSVPENSARLRNQWNRHRRIGKYTKAGVELHWDSPELGDRGDNMSVALADAFVRVITDEPLETAVAALDWALHVGIMDAFDFHDLMQQVPACSRFTERWVDAECESLPESLARTRLRLAGHSVVSQVPVGEVERIDLVVDDVVGLEVDGREYHVDRFEQDRRKDLAITLAGYHSMRPTARMVFTEWPEVQRGIAIAIAARGGNLSEIQEFRGSVRAVRRKDAPPRVSSAAES
jgi:very-short-patch-repair endonuclease